MKTGVLLTVVYGRVQGYAQVSRHVVRAPVIHRLSRINVDINIYAPILSSYSFD